MSTPRTVARDAAALARLDATAQAELVARGDLTPDELHRAFLRRADALNPLLRAIVEDQARHERKSEPGARRAGDEKRRRSVPAPFDGVPFVAKDSLAWPGMRWSVGSRLFAGRVADRGSDLSARLAASGLVCVGKSAMSELGLLPSTESLYDGATLNPWDLSRSPAGSSGGSAVAVAAGIVPIAHGSDGGGSVRIPASACGVFGFVPSGARAVSSGLGAGELASMTVDGCLTRSVRDAARFASLVDAEAPSPAVFVSEPLRRRVRIATWTATLFGTTPDAAVVRAHAETVALLEQLGHEVVFVEMLRFDAESLAAAFFAIAGAAVADTVAFVDLHRSEPVQENELEPFSWALEDRVRDVREAAKASAAAAFAAATRAYRDAVRGFDVVLTPTLATEPYPLGELSPVLSFDTLLRRVARVNGYAPMQNLLGAPAMSVPLCTAPSGLPIGMQFAASPGADALLLQLAYQLEEARPWRERWPPFSCPALDRA